jgi:sec-independent protein translocase protein TatA
MGALEPPHLILILVIVLIVFGPGKLPPLGKAIGDGLRELKHATSEEPSGKSGGAETATAAVGLPVSSAAQLCAQSKAPVPVTDRFCGACGAATRPSTTITSGTPSGGV